MDTPILTISMPNYNHAPYLPKRIPSLLSAMPANAELIILDDGSTDESAEIIEKFASEDKRIVFIRKKKNEGVIKALQDILSISRGEFISFQSSDDYVLPQFFSQLLTFSQQHPGFSVYTSNFGFCQDTIPTTSNEIEANTLLPNLKGPVFFRADQIVRIFFKTDFWVPGHASILRRDRIIEAGGFNPAFNQHADWFLIHSVALLGGVAYLPETLSVWRFDLGSFTSTEIAKKKKLFEIQMGFFRFLRKKEGRKLKSLFKRSGVMRGPIRQRLWSLCLRPIYWDFLWFYAIGFIQRRMRRLFKIHFDISEFQDKGTSF